MGDKIKPCKYCGIQPSTATWGEPERLDIFCDNYQCNPGASVTTEKGETFASTVARWNDMYSLEG